MNMLHIDKTKLPPVRHAPPSLSATNIPKTTLRGQFARGLIRKRLAKEIEMHRSLGHRGVHGLHFQNLELDGPITPNNLPRRPPRAKAADPAIAGSACIVGAGMAGLYTAMMLDYVGLPYVIYEADSRVGGRVYTYPFPGGRATEYVDFGAMRFPQIDSMTRVLKLMQSPEINVPLTPYQLSDPQQPSLFNDIRCIVTDNTPPDPFKVGESNGGPVQDIVANIPMDSLLTNTLGYFFLPYLQELNTNFATGSAELIENQSLDQYSTRQWLSTQLLPSSVTGGDPQPMGWDTVQWLETQDTSTNLFDESVIESIIDYFDFSYNSSPWVCVQGGTSLFAEKMRSVLKTAPQLDTRITSISIDNSNKSDANMLVAGVGPGSKPVAGNYNAVFNTTTLSCLQRIDLTGLNLTYEQKVAVRSLHYDVSTKVAIRFSCAWWRKYCGITHGGSATTDRPLRTCVYPSYNLGDSVDESAAIIVSYAWAQDAQRVGSLIGTDEDQLLETIYADLAALHDNPNVTPTTLKRWTLAHKSWDWSHDPNTSGAFALFGPGQFSSLYPCLTIPAADSKFFFTGEATSAHHAWIVGSFNSAYRSVMQYLERYQQYEKILLLATSPIFGGVDGTVLHDEVEAGDDGFLHLQVLLGRLQESEKLSMNSTHR